MRSPDSVDQPLLSSGEIHDLLHTAGGFATWRAARRPPPGRSGELLTDMQGSGTDFADVRPYQPGDDPRRIDWRATARSSAPLVRSYHSEADRPVCLVIDHRAGMRFGTRVRLKITQALRVALWFAGAELRAGHALSAMLFGAPCHWLPPQRGMVALQALIDAVNIPYPPTPPAPLQTSWATLLTGLRQRLPRGSTVLMLSDFSGLQATDSHLLRAVSAHCDAHALRLFDPAESRLPAITGLQLNWGKHRCSLNQGGAASAGQLADRQRAWSADLSSQMRRAGIAYREISTSIDDLGLALRGDR